MRTRYRSAVAVVLFLAVASPAVASPPSSGILQTIKRIFVRVASRVSPPGGSPAAPAEPTTTDTTGPTTTKTQ